MTVFCYLVYGASQHY